MKQLFFTLAALLVVAAPASGERQEQPRRTVEERQDGDRHRSVWPRALRHRREGVRRQQARAQSGSGTNLIGARVIDNIQPAGSGTYRANVFVADRDTNARGTIEQVGPNRLSVRGCVLAVICKTTHWDRVSR